jgi:hypothetical protein
MRHSRWYPFPALILSLAWGLVLAASATAVQGPPSPLAAKPIRERGVDGRVPTISFIESPAATCYRAEELSETCYIDWTYLYVTAATSQYILSMTVEIDGRLRANIQGFFQTYMYIPSEMYAPGFEVACGQPGAGGMPVLGSLYGFTIRATESGGGSPAANYGSVRCPATRHIFSDGFVSGSPSAWSAVAP